MALHCIPTSAKNRPMKCMGLGMTYACVFFIYKVSYIQTIKNLSIISMDLTVSLTSSPYNFFRALATISLRTYECKGFIGSVATLLISLRLVYPATTQGTSRAITDYLILHMQIHHTPPVDHRSTKESLKINKLQYTYS